MEFIGSAEGGLAAGVGGMIVGKAGEVGPVYFEGTFLSGRPHGAVRVEAPGEKPRIREYRAGEDTGAASASQWRALEL